MSRVVFVLSLWEKLDNTGCKIWVVACMLSYTCVATSVFRFSYEFHCTSLILQGEVFWVAQLIHFDIIHSYLSTVSITCGVCYGGIHTNATITSWTTLLVIFCCCLHMLLTQMILTSVATMPPMVVSSHFQSQCVPTPLPWLYLANTCRFALEMLGDMSWRVHWGVISESWEVFLEVNRLN